MSDRPHHALQWLQCRVTPQHGHSMLDNTLTSASSNLGLPIHGLVGTDFLADKCLDLRYHSADAGVGVMLSDDDLKCRSSSSASDSGGTSRASASGPASGVPLDVVLGVPVVTVTIAGVERRVVLDTGAAVSYLLSHLQPTTPPEGEYDDFSPHMGKFTTPIWHLPVRCGCVPVVEARVRFGLLTGPLASMLQIIGVVGVVGYDLFAGRVARFNFRHRFFRVSSPLSPLSLAADEVQVDSQSESGVHVPVIPSVLPVPKTAPLACAIAGSVSGKRLPDIEVD
jgi:hypothetical protein